MDLKEQRLQYSKKIVCVHVTVTGQCRGSHLVVQGGDLLLVGGGEEEAAHLALQGILHLHVDVVAGRLLLVVWIHADGEQRFVHADADNRYWTYILKGPVRFACNSFSVEP